MRKQLSSSQIILFGFAGLILLSLPISVREGQAMLLRNGADEVVYPEQQVAEWTAVRAASECIFDHFAPGDDHAIFELSVPEEWVGKTVSTLDIRKKCCECAGCQKRRGAEHDHHARHVFHRRRQNAGSGQER